MNCSSFLLQAAWLHTHAGHAAAGAQGHVAFIIFFYLSLLLQAAWLHTHAGNAAAGAQRRAFFAKFISRAHNTP